MADIIDQGCEREQADTENAINAARRRAAEITPGNPGTCYSFGEESQRLIKGAFANCRDKYELG